MNRSVCVRILIGLIFCIAAAPKPAAAELVLLAPMSAGKQALTRSAPNSDRQAPIVKLAAKNALDKAILHEADGGTVKFMLDLDESAQRIAGTKTKPTYLLISDEVGGFARTGFWLTDADNKVTWHADPYVDMTVDAGSVDDGSFEEEFAHEMGHVLLRRLVTHLPKGLSRTPHSSLAVTDYPTAFDEGFAIHFQGVARYLTENPRLKAVDQGLEFKPFVSYWQSNLDRILRIRGMRDNLFVQRQVPAALNVGDASSLFDPTHFKNGQQMLSSEGVIATLFYHLMLEDNTTTTNLAARYRSLFISLRTLNGEKLTSSSPLFLSLVRIHVQRLHALRSRWIGTVLDLTYGATANPHVLRELTQLSAAGQEGRHDEFVALLKRARSDLSALARKVVADRRLLDDAVGPELWIAVKHGDDVATINLNTAEKTTLVNILGIEDRDVDFLLADRWSDGPFKSVEDFAARRKAPPLLRQRLLDGHKLALSLGGYDRP